MKFPHINLLRNVLAYVGHVNTDPEVPAQYRIEKPVTFEGTIKLHGANCGVVWTPDGRLQAQSRDALLTPEDDFAGFAKFVVEFADQIRQIIVGHILPQLDGEVRAVALYGEWVGAGVVRKNKGSAVSKFDPKHWALFAAAVQGESENPRNVSRLLEGVPCEGRIGYVRRAGNWTLTVDFNNPASVEAAEAEAQRVTLAIEAECPYGKLYGLEGAGEGIVWMPTGEFTGREDLYWKHKTEAHSVVLEPKLQKERPAVAEDVQARIAEFVASVVTDNRLEQGLDALAQQGHEVSPKSTGHYLKWLTADVEREGALELEDAGLVWGQVSNAVMARGREFFLAAVRK